MPRKSKTNGTHPPQDAVIFVPSIGNEWTDQSLELIARKMSRALALQEGGRVAYTIDLQDEDNFGGGTETMKFYSISRSDPNVGTKEKILDLYEMNYRSLLIHDFEQRTLLVKSVVVLLTVISNIGRVFGAFFRSWLVWLGPKPTPYEKGKDAEYVESRRHHNATGITWLEKLQALYALVIFSMISAYMILLFLSSVGIIATAIASAGAAAANGGAAFDPASVIQSVVNTPFGGLASLFLAVVTLVAGVTHNQVREFILGIIVDYICMVDYINDDADEGQKRKLIAQLQDFMDRIDHHANGGYRRYAIVSFSFGSIVALDTLFPKEERERSVVVDKTSVLFTIGSPFDLIRSFWSTYFEKRNVCDLNLEWWNIFSPLDLLGSNFRNDDKADHPVESFIFKSGELCEIGFKPQNIQYGGDAPIRLSLRFLLLYALRAHSIYWDKSNDNSDAFEHVIRNLYPPAVPNSQPVNAQVQVP
jgi:hypothetical protein